MHIFYDIADTVTAFTAGKGCHGTEPGVDAREVGVTFPSSDEAEQTVPPSSFRILGSQNLSTPSPLGGGAGRGALFIPRQTHSVNVVWTDVPGEAPDSDAVITARRGLCVAVKTADCIPVLLYDQCQRLVAAIHAGWRGTVGRIVQHTIREMKSRGEDLHAVIGPGISLEAFEVGDEVYDAFLQAGFPMERIARRFPAAASQSLPSPSTAASILNSQFSINATKWHLDLWSANRWLLEQCGVRHIQVAGICTYHSTDGYYSARRETIKTGRNINGIMLL